jgi:thiosulfate/3-mercaptopyruvate sulfurtransferase
MFPLFLSATLFCGQSDYPNSAMLIEADALAKAERSQLLVLDVRKQKDYAAGHVPGAVHADVADWSKTFNSKADDKTWMRILGDMGIDSSAKVVVYSDDVRDAARCWFLLKSLGVDEVRLLNGGWKAWQATGGKVSTEPAAPMMVKGMLKRQDNRLATKDDVLTMLSAPGSQIIDARSAQEFCGDLGTAKKKGAIPGAKHLEWSEFIDKESQRFKPAAEIAKILKDANIDLAKPTVTYCQSGGRAAVAEFALELMGGKNVRNYYHSWAEWGNDESTPVVKPEKK